MDTLQFVLFKQSGAFRFNGKTHRIPQHHIVVADEHALAVQESNQDRLFITCRPSHLMPLHQDLISQAAGLACQQPYSRAIYRSVPADRAVIESTERLLHMEENLPICFLYLYCLGVDSKYFTNLLCQFVGVNIHQTLLAFFEQNYFNPWTVSRYAQEIGISPQKLNIIFQQKYGMPVKQWLIDKRLKRGGELLLTSNMRVADIALNCGFSNHAHFTALFRRRFHICPSLFRVTVKETKPQQHR